MNNAHRPIDSKREEYRKYLERTGVLDAITKTLTHLYEETEKPNDALSFIYKYIGDSHPDKVTPPEVVEQLNEKIKKLTEELETTKEELKANKDKLTATEEELNSTKTRLATYEKPTEVEAEAAEEVADVAMEPLSPAPAPVVEEPTPSAPMVEELASDVEKAELTGTETVAEAEPVVPAN